MASKIEIINMALTLLGESRIMSIDDDVKAAREAKALYDITADALMANYNWSFAKTRASVPAMTDAPAFEYAHQYQIPSDALRVLFVGDYYLGVDLSDCRTAPMQGFVIEGRKILTDLQSPLPLKYVKRITDTTQYAASFTQALAAALAEVLAEPLTQSEQKRARAEAFKNKCISLAVRANAIELPPSKEPDDEWMLSRR